jgi:HAMP domain-containing protein
MARIGLQTRLMGLALIPCLATGALVVERALAKRSAAREADELALLVKLTVIIGDLLHETQKERGSSSVFMSSSGTKFVRELEAQRVATDERRLRYLEFVRANDASWPPPVVAALRLADAQLSEIEARRRQATDLAVPVREIIAFYNELNRRLLESVASIASKSPDADLRGWSTAYYAFLHAKESTGMERAQLSNVFGADRFAPGQYFTVAALLASQRAYLRVFAATAPAALNDLYQEKARHPAFAAVEAKEHLAFDPGPDGASKGGFGVDSASWFRLMTQKIDVMKEVENATGAAILGRAAAVQTAAAAGLERTLLVGGPLFLAVMIGAWQLARRVVAPIRRLTAVADQVSAGDLDQHIATDAPAEVRELAESFKRMVDALRTTRSPPRRSPTGRTTGVRGVFRA